MIRVSISEASLLSGGSISLVAREYERSLVSWCLRHRKPKVTSYQLGELLSSVASDVLGESAKVSPNFVAFTPAAFSFPTTGS